MWSEKLPSGKVRFAERYIDPMTGQTKRVGVTMDKDTAQNRKLAAEILRQKMAMAPSAITFGELCDMYLSDQKPILKPSTWSRNNYALNTLKSILGQNTKPGRMTAGWIRKQLLDTGKQPGTLNEHLKRLKTVLRWGYNNDIIPEVKCPANFRDIPHKQKIEDKFLEASELSALVAGMKNDLWRDVTMFLALSGLRFGEAAALLRTDVDLATREISVNKTYDRNNDVVTSPKTYESNREVYMQDELLELCRRIKGQSMSMLFFQYPSGHISYNAYNHYLRRVALETIGRPITPHVLRHTCASLLMENGVEIDVISDRLGHADSKVTREIYLHVTAKLREKRNEQVKGVKMFLSAP